MTTKTAGLDDFEGYGVGEVEGSDKIVAAISDAQESISDPDSELSVPVLEGQERIRIRSSELLDDTSPLVWGKLQDILKGKINENLDEEHKKYLIRASKYVFRYFENSNNLEYRKMSPLILKRFFEFTGESLYISKFKKALKESYAQNGHPSIEDRKLAYLVVSFFLEFYPFKDRLTKGGNEGKKLEEDSTGISIGAQEESTISLVDLLVDNFDSSDDLIQPNGDQKIILKDLFEELGDYFPKIESKDPDYTEVLRRAFRRETFSDIGHAVKALKKFIEKGFKGIDSKDMERIFKIINFRIDHGLKNK